jgi:hypothetical protein
MTTLTLQVVGLNGEEQEQTIRFANAAAITVANLKTQLSVSNNALEVLFEGFWTKVEQEKDLGTHFATNLCSCSSDR